MRARRSLARGGGARNGPLVPVRLGPPETIGPITAEAGIPGPPQITFREVHNYLTAG